jgi:hypothetical protein
MYDKKQSRQLNLIKSSRAIGHVSRRAHQISGMSAISHVSKPARLMGLDKFIKTHRYYLLL